MYKNLAVEREKNYFVGLGSVGKLSVILNTEDSYLCLA